MTFLQAFNFLFDLITIICFIFSVRFSIANPKLTFINNLRYYFLASVTIIVVQYVMPEIPNWISTLVFINFEIIIFCYFFYIILPFKSTRLIIKYGFITLIIYQI